MSKVRQVVEWPFGAKGLGIKSKFAGLDFKQMLPVQQRPLGSYAKTAVLLYNMLLCEDPEASQAYRYFNRKCPPMALNDYMYMLREQKRVDIQA
jgi:hypothetical protein